MVLPASANTALCVSTSRGTECRSLRCGNVLRLQKACEDPAHAAGERQFLNSCSKRSPTSGTAWADGR